MPNELKPHYRSALYKKEVGTSKKNSQPLKHFHANVEKETISRI